MNQINSEGCWMEIDGKRIEGFAEDGTPILAREQPRVLDQANAKRQGRHDCVVLGLKIDDNPYKLHSINWAWWRASWRKSYEETKGYGWTE